MENTGIVQRFEEFGKKLYGGGRGWKKKYADALGVSPAQIGDMLSGRSAVGPKMQIRLREIGADVDYILTGRKKSGEREVVTQFEMPGHLTLEEADKYRKLQEEMKQIAEDDPEAIEKMLIIVQTAFKKKN